MAGRNKDNTAPDPRRVTDLKEKAKREQDMSTPNSGGTIHSVLYGAHNENSTASGRGEFSQ